jgi:hypothetical protein
MLYFVHERCKNALHSVMTDLDQLHKIVEQGGLNAMNIAINTVKLNAGVDDEDKAFISENFASINQKSDFL